MARASIPTVLEIMLPADFKSVDLE